MGDSPVSSRNRGHATGRPLKLAACLAITLSSLASADEPDPFENLAALFAYDKAATVDVRVEGLERAGGVELATISYAGARGRVSATLVTPAASGKHAAVIFMHDSGQKRDEFLAEAILLARANPAAVSLLIDAPPVRPVGWRRNYNTMIEGHDRDIHVQAVVDIRRGIDLLAARSDVDPGRIAYVGRGVGANWGSILSGVEPRLRALVVVAGVPSVTELMRDDDPEWADVRYVMGEQRFSQYVDSLSAVDPIRFTSHSRAARVLFQFGVFDPYVPRGAAERLVKSMASPHQVVFYEAGHLVNHPRAVSDRAAFLAEAGRIPAAGAERR